MTLAHGMRAIFYVARLVKARVLVDDVGVESCELLGTPDDEALPEGFRRPIYCAVKGPGA